MYLNRKKQELIGRACRLHFGLIAVSAALCCLPVGGCTDCLVRGPFDDYVSVRGTLVDADTMEPLRETIVGVRNFFEGEEVGFGKGNATSFQKSPVVPTTDENGLFALAFTSGFRGACGTLNPEPNPAEDLSFPDQVQVTVRRAECAQLIMIDLNEDTVVDITFPDDLIDLKDPILVPACEP